MMMTEADMAKEFREAKNRAEQIETLAIMNLLTEGEVVDILIHQGVKRDDIPKKYQKFLKRPSALIVVPDSVKNVLQMRIIELDVTIAKKRKQMEEIEHELDAMMIEREQMASFAEGSIDYAEKSGSV